MSPKIAVVIPTINRKAKLRNCLKKLQDQNYSNLKIYVVNNASTDGTDEMLKREFPSVVALNYSQMLGSAGGYKKGLEKAFEDGADWFWLMDDDAWPEKDALENLIKYSDFDESKVFASVSLDENKSGNLSWTNDILVDAKIFNVGKYSELGKKDLVESNGIGYLGLFLPRVAVAKVGYPDDKMFAWVDDVDYFWRIRRSGFRMFYVRKSFIYHPRADYQEINLLFKKVMLSRSTPWKEYYSIRNSVYLCMKYQSKLTAVLFKIPKQMIFYSIVLLFYRDEKFKRLKLYSLAFFDGLFLRMGFRITPNS